MMTLVEITSGISLLIGAIFLFVVLVLAFCREGARVMKSDDIGDYDKAIRFCVVVAVTSSLVFLMGSVIMLMVSDAILQTCE